MSKLKLQLNYNKSFTFASRAVDICKDMQDVGFGKGGPNFSPYCSKTNRSQVIVQNTHWANLKNGRKMNFFSSTYLCSNVEGKICTERKGWNCNWRKILNKVDNLQWTALSKETSCRRERDGHRYPCHAERFVYGSLQVSRALAPMGDCWETAVEDSGNLDVHTKRPETCH